MKINTRICDICGKSIYQHARHTYVLRKRLWEIGELGNRIDLCEDCYEKMITWLRAEKEKNTGF